MVNEGRIFADGMTELIPVACILRKKLDELISGKSGDDSALGMRAILEFAAPHLRSGECSSSTTMFWMPGLATVTPCWQLDPAIWSRLPEEVLEVILAKLPVPEIHRLRCVSTRWKHNLVETRSRFRELCARMSSRMFALVNEDTDLYAESDGALFKVKLYDTGTNKWHVYQLHLGLQENPWTTISTSDGGLVCFLFPWDSTKECPLHVVVCNPLTQRVKKLVLKGVHRSWVGLFQIVTDRETGHYKVILGWRMLDGPGKDNYVVDMFDSRTDKWSNSSDSNGGDQLCSRDLFWGRRKHMYHGDFGPCVWDSAELQLNVLDKSPIQGAMSVEYTLLRDRLYVIHLKRKTYFVGDPDKQGSTELEKFDSDDDEDEGKPMPWTFKMIHYCISEYQGQLQEPHWVRLRTINCKPFQLPDSTMQYGVELHAFEGFLLVVAYNEDRYRPYDREIGWLYDLSTDEWRTLPSMPRGLLMMKDVMLKPHGRDSIVCELRWDVDPSPLNVADEDQFLLPVSVLSDEY